VRIVIGKKLLSTIGGSEAQARALAGALRDRGHTVTLVGLRPSHRRAGIPERVYAARPGDVTIEQEGLTYRFIASPAALLDGILPLSLVGAGRLEAGRTRRQREPRVRRSSRPRSCIRASRSRAPVRRTSRATAATTPCSASPNGRRPGIERAASSARS
jgi:hypothetical protein